MSLPTSGLITLGAVNTELGNSSTAPITLNDSVVRTLFGLSSGLITLNDGHGKSNNYSIYTSSSGGGFLSYNNSPISYTNGSTFTVECFIYMTGYDTWGDYWPVMGDINPTGGGSAWSLAIGSTGTMFMFSFTGQDNYWESNETISLNTWSHVAYVAQSGTVTMYINGNACSQKRSTGGGNSLQTPYQHFTYCSFQNYTGTNALFGYASNLRCNTNALYTGNFTPPSSILTNISGTTLLACRYPSATTDGSGNITISTNGNISVSTFVPF